MEQFLRFSGASRHDPDVAAWFGNHPDELGDLARKWFSRIRKSGDDVLELFHDGCPVACVGDAPFAYVNVFSAHMNVGFYLGAALNDPESILQGTGKRMRHVKFRPGQLPDEDVVDALIAAAYADIKTRVAQV